jgi:hypothetical protein
VDTTIVLARWMYQLLGRSVAVKRAADLSCGNGAILSAIPAETRYFGDFAPGHEYCGPIEQTIDELPEVDLFVCSETIEHLDDPDAVLATIRSKAWSLVLSTPVDAWHDSNPEHYWAWSRTDVEEMLTAVGWRTSLYSEVDFRPLGMPYCFGIWGAR